MVRDARCLVCSVMVKREDRAPRLPCPTGGHVVYPACTLGLHKNVATADLSPPAAQVKGARGMIDGWSLKTSFGIG